MGDVGAVASLIDTILSYILPPGGLEDHLRREALANKRQEAIDALHRGDFGAVHQHLDELRELANKP